MHDDGTLTHALMDRYLYEIPEAARLLRVPDPTLRWWLQGKTYRGRSYLPVLRQDLNDDKSVRWGEFIEAAILKFLRRDRVKKLSMKELRLFRLEVKLRHPDLKYPLADDLYINADRLSRSDAAGIWEPSTGTTFDEAGAEQFLERCHWQEHIPVRFQPIDECPDVYIFAHKKAGAPQIRGVRTEAIYELKAAGESDQALIQGFGLTGTDIQEAIHFENLLRELPQAA